MGSKCDVDRAGGKETDTKSKFFTFVIVITPTFYSVKFLDSVFTSETILTFSTSSTYKVCSWVCLMFLALQLNRGNISQALSNNVFSDLDLITNDYNYGMAIYYACFLYAELPF